MLLLGKQITAPSDVLQPVPVEKVCNAIRNTNGAVATLQKRLREIRMIDVNQYRKLKTGLPYLVCGHFYPKIRKRENFVFTERFFVDIDHLSQFDLDMAATKQKLQADARVELLFMSPGGDGLKVLFVLNHRITDTGYYTLFYKTFCMRFAEQYDLKGAVDVKTHDVSRCCFVSHDAEAYFNPAAEKIENNDYLSEDGAFNLGVITSEIRTVEKEQNEEKKELGIANERNETLSDDILNQIKAKVGMRVKKPVEKTYVQPQELDVLMPQVVTQLESVGASLQKMTPIHYGRQLYITAGQYWAEINLFFGSRGVSIVGTTKTGSNQQLCDSIVLLLKDHFQ